MSVRSADSSPPSSGSASPETSPVDSKTPSKPKKPKPKKQKTFRFTQQDVQILMFTMAGTVFFFLLLLFFQIQGRKKK